MIDYRACPNYTRTLCRPDGSVIQTFIHCGTCMSIIVGVECEHCARKRHKKKKASREALLTKKQLSLLSPPQ